MPRLKVGRLTTPVRRNAVAHAVDADPVPVELGAQQRRDPRRRARRLQRQDPPPVMVEAEGDIAARHRQPLHRVEAGRIFGARAAQELAPRRHLVEQAPRPGPACRAASAAGPSPDAGAMVDLDPPAVAHPLVRLSSVSRDTLAIDGSASPRKPKLVTASMLSSASFEVACRSSASRMSAGLMPQPSSVTSISPMPPPDRRIATLRRAGVERIFDQFLERARGPLDHLARGNPVDQFGRQSSY